MVTTRTQRKEVLVTGGAGFLGHHLLDQLVAAGIYSIKVFDITKMSDDRFVCLQGDLTSYDDVAAACAGVDIVFHVATAAPTAQNAASAQELMTNVNVQGTQNVIQACVEAKVNKLIFTSTASVVFEGKPLVDIDETHPYAAVPMDFYTGTKMEAEKLVLAANSSTLATCALRPSGIFGPGNDKLLVPGVIERARSGKIKYMIGDGSNTFDWTYVGNVAQAHLCAASVLEAGSPASGKAFFISNDEHSGFWEMLGDISEGLGYERPSVKLPVVLMMVVAVISSWLGSVFKFKTDLNPMRVRIASVQRTVSCEKAKKLLGYKPTTSLAEGKKLMIAGFQSLHKREWEAAKDK